MQTLREARLKKEVQERVLMNDGDVHKSFQEVLDHLYKEHELYYDNDRHVQAIDTWKDILELKHMINKFNEL